MLVSLKGHGFVIESAVLNVSKLLNQGPRVSCVLIAAQ